MIEDFAVVCISNKICADLVNSILIKHGINYMSLNDDFSAFLRTIRSRDVNLVIMDDDAKSLSNYQLLYTIKNTQQAVEAILFSNNYNELNEYIKKGIIFGYFSMPLNNFEIEQLILSAVRSSRRTYKLQNELEELKSKLKNRILIEKAKEIVADDKNISLDKAYKAMQSLSMNKGISLEKLAQIIIENNEKSE
ncbi:MAG: ANTAR domain-containing protein [Eubacteriaceae bacterium]|nr:ANTAR domain-containing protein [Eubacteriaceae bacterium]